MNEFCATYREPNDCDEATHNTIMVLNEQEEDQSLEEVLDNCQQVGCDADLYDAAGWRKGWVHRDGGYQLT